MGNSKKETYINKTSNSQRESSGNDSPRRLYMRPQILSAEKLEATAGSCEPAVPPLGKPANIQCDGSPYGS